MRDHHMKQHMAISDRPFQCRVCSFFTDTMKKARAHSQACHEGKKIDEIYTGPGEPAGGYIAGKWRVLTKREEKARKGEVPSSSSEEPDAPVESPVTKKPKLELRVSLKKMITPNKDQRMVIRKSVDEESSSSSSDSASSSSDSEDSSEEEEATQLPSPQGVALSVVAQEVQRGRAAAVKGGHSEDAQATEAAVEGEKDVDDGDTGILADNEQEEEEEEGEDEKEGEDAEGEDAEEVITMEVKESEEEIPKIELHPPGPRMVDLTDGLWHIGECLTKMVEMEEKKVQKGREQEEREEARHGRLLSAIEDLTKVERKKESELYRIAKSLEKLEKSLPGSFPPPPQMLAAHQLTLGGDRGGRANLENQDPKSFHQNHNTQRRK